MFELYGTGMLLQQVCCKTQQLEEEEELFICHIHSYTEYNPAVKCSSAFNPSKSTHTWSSGHKPGAVDTHTHLEQWTHTHLEQWTQTHTWSNGHTHTHLEQWKHTHTHTHTHTPHTHTHTHTHTHNTHTHLEQWAHTHTHLEQSTLQRPGSSWGFGALLKGLTSVVDNSCRSREPTTSDYKSNALSIRPRLHLDYNLQLYCVTSHTVWLSEK